MKRFYKAVSIREANSSPSPGGRGRGIAAGGPAGEGETSSFEILLDGRPVKTPATHTLALPTHALAEAIAAEWAGQGETIDPVAMPLLRLANTVIDGAGNREALIAAILRFGENDLLCYRAHQPPELARRQDDAWDPFLEWAERQFGAKLAVAAGLNHIEQLPEAIAALRAAVTAFDPFALAGLHVIASVTGSLLLGLALAEGRTSPAHAFKLSRLDEDYQAEKWGADREAETRAAALARELDKAAEFIRLASA
jgi:chaperone required for assembly of F1-ATPase